MIEIERLHESRKLYKKFIQILLLYKTNTKYGNYIQFMSFKSKIKREKHTNCEHIIIIPAASKQENSNFFRLRRQAKWKKYLSSFLSGFHRIGCTETVTVDSLQ